MDTSSTANSQEQQQELLRRQQDNESAHDEASDADVPAIAEDEDEIDLDFDEANALVRLDPTWRGPYDPFRLRRGIYADELDLYCPQHGDWFSRSAGTEPALLGGERECISCHRPAYQPAGRPVQMLGDGKVVCGVCNGLALRGGGGIRGDTQASSFSSSSSSPDQNLLPLRLNSLDTLDLRDAWSSGPAAVSGRSRLRPVVKELQAWFDRWLLNPQVFGDDGSQQAKTGRPQPQPDQGHPQWQQHHKLSSAALDYSCDDNGGISGNNPFHLLHTLPDLCSDGLADLDPKTNWDVVVPDTDHTHHHPDQNSHSSGDGFVDIPKGLSSDIPGVAGGVSGTPRLESIPIYLLDSHQQRALLHSVAGPESVGGMDWHAGIMGERFADAVLLDSYHHHSHQNGSGASSSWMLGEDLDEHEQILRHLELMPRMFEGSTLISHAATKNDVGLMRCDEFLFLWMAFGCHACRFQARVPSVRSLSLTSFHTQQPSADASATATTSSGPPPTVAAVRAILLSSHHDPLSTGRLLAHEYGHVATLTQHPAPDASPEIAEFGEGVAELCSYAWLSSQLVSIAEEQDPRRPRGQENVGG